MDEYGTEGIKTSFLKDLVKRDLLDHLSLCEGSKVSHSLKKITVWSKFKSYPFSIQGKSPRRQL